MSEFATGPARRSAGLSLGKHVQIFVVKRKHVPGWLQLAVHDPEARLVLACVIKFLRRPSDAAVDCLVCGRVTPDQPQTIVVLLNIPPDRGPALVSPLCREHAGSKPQEIAQAAARYLGGYAMPNTPGTA